MSAATMQVVSRFHFFPQHGIFLTLNSRNNISAMATSSENKRFKGRLNSQTQYEIQAPSFPSISFLGRKPELKTDGSSSKDEEKEVPSVGSFSSSQDLSATYDQGPLEINLDLAVYKARSLFRRGRYEKAEQLLRKCIKYWPENGRPYVVLGRILCEQGRFEEARVLYENGCQATQGENPYIWQGWAVLEQKMGKVKKARKLYDAAIVANKKHVAAWHAWACLEIREGNVKKARELLKNGLKNCGPSPYIFHTLALLEIKARRYEKAQSFLLEAIRCNPKSCPVWLSWAQLEVRRGNVTAARRLFERAVQASPKNRYAWQMWALFEASQEENDKARKYFKVGIALNPRDPVILQSFAIFEYNCSSAAVAREIFQKASEVDPTHQPIWNAWGWMEWKEGNIDEARKLYQRCLSINSRSSDASICFQQWGQLEEAEQNIETARRLFKASIDIDSQSYPPWVLWAELEERQGNVERAEEIRTLYFHQKTEVVRSDLMDMNISELFAPAIGHLRNLLSLDFKTSQIDKQKEDSSEEKLLQELDTILGIGSRENVAFDVDAFIRKTLALDVSKLHFDGNGQTAKSL
eukprot:TRINITY_DN859_c0_g1_i1.p1 TRINITY_DN859_c0_g1~~TRINITY_DN859_c0_g1_i1.p1  ORF type:complete len:581 (+),score=136.63 TRINITY_DN859_c0_g1_i1:129-1871(+)